jgi:hypothetical protein
MEKEKVVTPKPQELAQRGGIHSSCLSAAWDLNWQTHVRLNPLSHIFVQHNSVSSYQIN